MYPLDGVDTSGLAALRALVLDQIRRTVPAPATPALATSGSFGPTAPGPAYTLAEISSTAGRRTRNSPHPAQSAARSGAHSAHSAQQTHTAAPGAHARRPAADTDSGRMMDLVERAQDGETEAFGRLYDHYSDTVYRYIYYRVGAKATAEDLTSETFLRALRRIGTFTWQGRDFGAWLVTIARNLVADHFKSSRFRLEVTTGEMLDANEVEPSPEDSVLESLSNEALLTAVRKLNPQQQECVTLRFLQGLSVAETARVMGKNEGAIKTLQYRAVRTLARLLPEDAR